jgi:hypothetical protein
MVAGWITRHQQHVITGLDHGIGHLAFMSPQQSERLTPNRG